MQKHSEDKKINSFKVRIYDDDLLTSLNELAATKEFSSMNELMNAALSVGIEKMYIARGKRRVLAPKKEDEYAQNLQMTDILKKLKAAELTQDDIFVMLNVMEMLLTSIYNVEIMKIRGEAVSAEMVESGYLAELPENVKDVKDILIKRMSSKKEKR